jgi:hypothetical protein
MISVKMPTTAILLKKPRRLYEDRFVFTYDYGWSGSADVGSSKGDESLRVTGFGLCVPVCCSWSDVIIRFSVDGRAGV